MDWTTSKGIGDENGRKLGTRNLLDGSESQETRASGAVGVGNRASARLEAAACVRSSPMGSSTRDERQVLVVDGGTANTRRGATVCHC